MKFCGKLFLLGKGNEDGPPETFTQVGGMRSTGMTINQEAVEITSKDDSDERQILPGCGIRSMSVSLAGLFSDEAKLNEMLAEIASGQAVFSNYQITSQRGDSFTGPFQIASMERNGEKTDSEQYSVTLESAGNIAFVPA